MHNILRPILTSKKYDSECWGLELSVRNVISYERIGDFMTFVRK